MTPNGSAIKALRLACNVSLRELARKTGLHRSFLSRVERGLSGVSESNLRRIADSLNAPVAAINREEQS
ncbi:helix-turn-helix domain-containing protein [Kitasatospora cineracea]|uniref:helix-turn-helix domain-containing protein n=1 Tax=Kitasatospora cineracea TaxID=88074 RepID=UPI00369AC2DD